MADHDAKSQPHQEKPHDKPQAKGLTDDQLKQAMTAWSDIQDLIANPQVTDTATLRAFLSELEGVSTAQLALGLLVKGGK